METVKRQLLGERLVSVIPTIASPALQSPFATSSKGNLRRREHANDADAMRARCDERFSLPGATRDSPTCRALDTLDRISRPVGFSPFAIIMLA
jgi:hypothetical protein